MGEKSCCAGTTTLGIGRFHLIRYFSLTALLGTALIALFLFGQMKQVGPTVFLGVMLPLVALNSILFLIAWRAQEVINRHGTALDNLLSQVKNTSLLLDEKVKERTAELSTVNAALAIEIEVRRRSEEKFRSQAYRDPLTGLPNRAHLQERIDSAIQHAQRDNSTFAVFFIDLDNFKEINDTLGHAIGDELLRLVANDMSCQLSNGTALARLDGDEFVLVADVTDKDHAAAIAQKILDVIHRPFRLADMELYLDATVGISIYPFDDEDGIGLIRKADTAMFRAKADHRDHFRFYSPEITASAEERTMLNGLLRTALENGELFVAYQPQVDLHEGKLVGVEALLRWKHPTLGSIPPGRLIQVAEESGFIRTLGDWILRQACGQVRKWLDCGLKMPQVSINISPRQFERDEFVDQVRTVLKETGIPADRLELEITEFTLMTTPNGDELLRELHALGVQLSIDDFGTGYSSLNYLKRLPVQKLKIDRSFVQDLENDTNGVAIVRSVIALAKTMGLVTVAEGVENPAQAEFLAREGCDQVQGFLYSKPIPADDLILRWAEHAQGKDIGEITALYEAKASS